MFLCHYMTDSCDNVCGFNFRLLGILLTIAYMGHANAFWIRYIRERDTFCITDFWFVKFGLSFVFGQNYITTFGPISVSAEFIKISAGRSLIPKAPLVTHMTKIVCDCQSTNKSLIIFF